MLGLVRNRCAAAVLTLVPVMGIVVCPRGGIIVSICLAVGFILGMVASIANMVPYAYRDTGCRLIDNPFAVRVARCGDGRHRVRVILTASADLDLHAVNRAGRFLHDLPLVKSVGVRGVVTAGGGSAVVPAITRREGENKHKNQREGQKQLFHFVSPYSLLHPADAAGLAFVVEVVQGDDLVLVLELLLKQESVSSSQFIGFVNRKGLAAETIATSLLPKAAKQAVKLPMPSMIL